LERESENSQSGFNASESFYSGALDRIRRFMLVLWIALSVGGWLRFGWRLALGFACGCGIAYVNFYWLKRVVSGMADRIAQTDGYRSLYYIECYSREPLRVSGRPVIGCSSDRVRSRV